MLMESVSITRESFLLLLRKNYGARNQYAWDLYARLFLHNRSISTLCICPGQCDTVLEFQADCSQLSNDAGGADKN